jgi:hyperosmotically inducible protein
MNKRMWLKVALLALAIPAAAAADHHKDGAKESARDVAREAARDVERTADKAADKAQAAGAKAEAAAEKGGKVVNDSWLTAKTKIALYADSRVAGTKINVDTRGGVVTLRGKVDSAEAKTAAGEVALGIEGVKTVKNELQVVAPGKREVVEAKDEAIKEQIDKAISRDAQLRDAGIQVRSDAGVVTLTGKAPSWAASAKASELSRNVRGVRAVKNQLDVAG